LATIAPPFRTPPFSPPWLQDRTTLHM
jgi:hypothetical protein